MRVADVEKLLKEYKKNRLIELIKRLKNAHKECVNTNDKYEKILATKKYEFIEWEILDYIRNEV